MAENYEDISYQQPSPLPHVETFVTTTGSTRMPPPNRASVPTAALVAEFFEKCGANIGKRFPKYEIGGVRVYDETFGVGTGVVNVCGACCRLDIIDMPANHGIRNALVGAVLAWLWAPENQFPDKAWTGTDSRSELRSIHRMPAGNTYIESLDREEAGLGLGTGNEYDPLRALLLAALAVADKKEEGK